MRSTQKKSHLIYILPQVLLFTIFFLMPLLFGIIMAFTDYNLSGLPTFVGFKNFLRLFSDSSVYAPKFWETLKNTFYFVILTVPLLIIVPLILAQLVNQVKKFQGVFQSIFYIPTLFSVTSALLVWTWLLNNESGFVNYILIKYIGKSIPWLTNLPWVWVSMIIATLWWTVGNNFLVYLASLQEVPQQLYEAASLDGASSFQKFIHVTIPGIKNQLIYTAVMTIIASANVFGQPNLMTGGGPGESTKVMSMLIRDVAFTGTIPRAGLASAMSVVFGLLLIVFSFVAMYYTDKLIRDGD